MTTMAVIEDLTTEKNLEAWISTIVKHKLYWGKG